MNILYFSFIYLFFHLYLSIYFYIICNSYLEFYVFHFYLLISLSLSIYLCFYLFIAVVLNWKFLHFPNTANRMPVLKTGYERTTWEYYLYVQQDIPGLCCMLSLMHLFAPICRFLRYCCSRRRSMRLLARGIIAGCRFVMSLNPHKSTNSAYYSRNSSYYSPTLTVFYRTPGTHEPANSPTRIFH